MLKRYDIDVEFYEDCVELENKQSVYGEYCLYEDVNKILQEYEHEINDLQEQLDIAVSDRDMWKDCITHLINKMLDKVV